MLSGCTQLKRVLRGTYFIGLCLKDDQKMLNYFKMSKHDYSITRTETLMSYNLIMTYLTLPFSKKIVVLKKNDENSLTVEVRISH